MGGLLETCSEKHRHPRSSLRSHSYVSPRSASNGFATRNTCVAWADTAKAVTIAIYVEGTSRGAIYHFIDFFSQSFSLELFLTCS